MHIDLHPRFTDTELGRTAQALTSACVHCGFCLATCPTYIDTRDERDSPRGRIYLIKQLLEQGSAGSATQTHLDRCLTCRNCETTCPSGMEYGQLLDLGRGIMEQEAPRATVDSVKRRAIRWLFAKPRLLRLLLIPAQFFRRLLPAFLAEKVPPRQRAGPLPVANHARRMLVLEGCVQQAATPRTNAAARRVLDALGITLIAAPQAACCGALDYHLGAHEAGLDKMRRNIDAWWPHVEAGAEALVSSASGCGAMLIDYGRLLAHDPAYAEKASRIAALGKDLGEIVAAEQLDKLGPVADPGAIAIHTPCTLQHAVKQPGHVADILARVGLAASEPATLCCGSAGTYSLLEPAASTRIRASAVDSLCTDNPEIIATANVGCQLHLQGGAPCAVKHWIELLDERLDERPMAP